MALPSQLQLAVEQMLSWQAAAGRRHEAERLSRHYRAGGISDASVAFPAYLTVRLPATFAAVSSVLAEVRRLYPQLEPRSLVDAGSGPGTASWAAAESWPELADVSFLDNNQHFLALALELGQFGPAALQNASGLNGSIAQWPAGLKADLVVAAYALAELPLAQIPHAARALWSAANQALVLVEPGTPQGFARIRAARDTLLAEGAIPAAPCTHAKSCPMAAGDWCHFSVRLQRSRAHMQAKSATLPFEDEKFSYLVLLRDGAVTGGARVVAPPFDRKPGITFRLCCARGLESRHIARRDTAAYKACRKTAWGDVLPIGKEEQP